MKKTKSKPKKNKIIQRLRVTNGMLKSGIDPRWMVLKSLPIVPPELRPMVQLTGGRFATSDLNDLYRRVINRNNRLKRLMSLGAPEIILRNEKRMLQEAVDSLIDASKSKARLTRRRTPPRSLSDLLRGKKGRFRKNLLGKRVDYSGRSVIVVGPELNLDQCGLPREIALEIFRPFILRELMLRGLAPNIKSAKNLLDHRISEVYDILEEVVQNKLVLLNRAPTLHKLSVQGFYPILTDDLAIRLHPCVTSGFNADFDGDQMAVLLPLSKKAQKESKKKIISSENLLKPADGSPVNVPSKEMIVGCYFATSIKQSDLKAWEIYKKENKLPESIEYFSCDSEAINAYELKKIALRDLVGVKIDQGVVLTTVGRLLFNQILPKKYGFVNESINSGVIKKILANVFKNYTNKDYVNLVDKIKDFGFWGMTLSGLSLAISDSGSLPEKAQIIKESNERVEGIDSTFAEGLITEEEKLRLSRDVWLETTDRIAAMTWALLESDSPIKMISGAGVKRVSQDQIKQVSGIRGLVVDPLGRIVPLPTKSSFREGLSVFEYVTGARGSRKGLTDTALKTADAGYLTRKLVDVSHAAIVRELDCGTKRWIEVKKSGERAESFEDRLISRVAAEDIKDGKKVIVAKGEIIDEEKLAQISGSKITSVKVRSPLTCESKQGICSACYGWDLSNRKSVEIGVPVGIMAAQSIGEPGTQLTLRTKHSGGVIGLDVTQGLPRVQELFEMRTPKSPVVLSEITGKVRLTESDEAILIRVKSKEDIREYIIPKGSKILVQDGQEVSIGTQLVAGSVDVRQLMELRSLEEAKQYLLDEIQKVYESQGITIHDKHFEVIIHEMSSRIQITSPGDTELLIGSYVDEITFDEINEAAKKDKGTVSQGRHVLLGVTQASLNTNSWLSSASFQETTNILTDAAILGREDKLIGMKENVIIGRLIPVTKKRVELE
jgi:DNA-directed RNA polymerase subunit beta'